MINDKCVYWTNTTSTTRTTTNDDAPELEVLVWRGVDGSKEAVLG